MIKLNVNGKVYELEIESHEKLAKVLRDKLGLRGVRVSCQEGECGSCTVLLDGKPVTSCIMLAMQAEGTEISTVEGLADGGKLSPIQRSFLDHGAYQCGFCTSGMLMSATALLKESPEPKKEQIMEAIHGNICRCTGYNSIVRAIKAVAEGKYKEEE